ncbi:MAG: M81 family metallopeptidase [Fuerstiella sp.]|nr:M81 family metallopeptidase [Fuerstiella sp.]
MARRILIAELKQETATFNPAPTVYEDFRIAVGVDMRESYRGTKTEVAGAIDVLDNDGRFEIVPTMAAASVSGGYIRSNDLDRLLNEMVDAIRDAGPVDGACLCLHGAMAGESEDDPEGRVLSEIRSALGTVPIVVSLDLHAVITDRLVDTADVLVPYHTYPHTDHYETGQRAARNLIRLIDGDARPTVARVKLPMLVRGDELLTAGGKFGEAIRMCQRTEQSNAGLSAGVIIGNAFTDVPALQSNVLVTTDDDMALAQREAEHIGRFMWDHRELFQAQLTSLGDAIRQAASSDGLVVFSDAADATASGAAGDSNAILGGLINASFTKRTLIAIVDAPAVAEAYRAGVEAAITVSLGGTRDPARFTPLTLAVHVKSLHDGQFSYEDGTAAQAGRVCVLAMGTIHILVTERPVFVVGQRVFQSHGLNPVDYDLVVVKSPNGFRTWYESIAGLIVSVDVPGSTSANLKSLPFRNCVRPIFPLDDDVPSPFESN